MSKTYTIRICKKCKEKVSSNDINLYYCIGCAKELYIHDTEVITVKEIESQMKPNCGLAYDHS